MRLDPTFTRALTRLVASGTTGRGPSGLCLDGVWQQALDLISDRETISVISGFYVPSAAAPETDGPAGSLVLARALLRIGRDVSIWTDALCADCFRRGAGILGFPTERIVEADGHTFPDNRQPDLLIYVERLGRAADGAYYNMRSEDITKWTAPLDAYALATDIPVIGIGDGGNEVGMGSMQASLADMMPHYTDCLCVVSSDVCIPVDVSNWGAYALTTVLSKISGRWLGQTEAEEREMMQALCDCGVVDGVQKTCSLSVDGIGLDDHLHLRNELEKLSQ